MRRSIRTALIAAFVLLIVNGRFANATVIYDWVPCTNGGGSTCFGFGAITLTPTGALATDTDFATSIVTDFQFIFGNGAPTVTLSDLVINIVPEAVGGTIITVFFREGPSFNDARLVFAAGSADYKNFINPFVPALFPVEINSGTWVLSSLVPPPPQ